MYGSCIGIWTCAAVALFADETTSLVLIAGKLAVHWALLASDNAKWEVAY